MQSYKKYFRIASGFQFEAVEKIVIGAKSYFEML